MHQHTSSYSILYLLIGILFFCSCKKEVVPGEFFPVTRISSLKIENLEDFWEDDRLSHTVPYVIEVFDQFPGHLYSISYVSENYNMIAVSVFQTDEKALAAMELRSNELPGVYIEGDTLEMGRRWWYTDDQLAGVYNAYVNALNTIIEIHYYYDDPAQGRALVLSTAKTLVLRVERMGE